MPLAAAADPAKNDSLINLNGWFHSTEWYVARNLGIFVLGVFWLATAFWTFKDARRRIGDPWLVATATALGLVPPFLGPLVYMLFRPPEYLADVRERELEIRAMEERVGDYDLVCPVCRAEVEASFLVCPVCTTRLKQACSGCGRPLEPLWQVCPHCETPVARPGPVLEPVENEPPRRGRASRGAGAG